ncbi:u3 small nucleolar ribonucleoprotein lcp5 [Ophiostoma piceae UAMH 11346]|uniref:U3 small nucleolar ribonucleoprotein lcp5 n=1 Tax=Ophiostoma piceae (strain UAMH 11346) TaxID=1262450 RepID=S3BZQ4_OPHP1|nr:u3 small nucleolar ribonucleoprotein lcp5 [Ophiostoma piceae UAMH 11346]
MSAAKLPQLLDSLRQSVASVAEATPKLSALTPPEDGLSLLDVKNELLLSYLEHMVFLIVLKLRNASSATGAESESDLSLENSDLGQSVVKKLVELRLYLEKGVRPLEEKLRYQVEKALRAAEEVERAARQKQQSAAAAAAEEEDSDSGSDDERNGDDAGFVDEEEAVNNRPNRAAFVRPASSTAAAAAKTKASGDDADAGAAGVYRPPKIAPTLMPETQADRRERAARRPLKSATMDEFIADELSTAPMAQLSVGANIAARGRHMTTAKEREREEERREYEERNFIRLPKESKKDRSQRNKADSRSSQMNFGGEEWRGLGEGVDRINRMTQRRSGSGSAGGSTRSMLDKSRKRGIDTVDGPRGSGLGEGHDGGIGGRFSKKLRHHEMGSHRDRKKK